METIQKSHERCLGGHNLKGVQFWIGPHKGVEVGVKHRPTDARPLWVKSQEGLDADVSVISGDPHLGARRKGRSLPCGRSRRQEAGAVGGGIKAGSLILLRSRRWIGILAVLLCTIVLEV